jgi:hypothetical protein
MGRSSKAAAKHHRGGTKHHPKPFQEKDLERFAGSSEEESESSSEDEQQEDSRISQSPRDVSTHREHDDRGESSADESDDSERSDDEDDEADRMKESDDHHDVRPVSGMANAMLRILGDKQKWQKRGATATTNTKPVVLSKTKTPLQRMAEQEKLAEKEMKEKRRMNRERKLTALHVPLTVATSSASAAATNPSNELEQERMHRRIATRGIVALFNAIAQHQKRAGGEGGGGGTSTESAAKSAEGGNKSGVQKMTKDGFLDMIKQSSANLSNKTVTRKHKVVEEVDKDDKSDKRQWNALRDDFMLNPKKNWDQESSEEEEAPEQWSDDDEEEKGTASPPKKQRATS